MSPVTLHVKVKVPPEHMGGAAVNCPVAAPAWREMDIYMPALISKLFSEMFCVVCVCRLDRYVVFITILLKTIAWESIIAQKHLLRAAVQ